ncbi:MAG: glycosyl hydrolase family 18 protein [Bacillota bacterium]|nr:glycosyl hydrolase family 18 protein [Bacillota bacterium]
MSDRVFLAYVTPQALQDVTDSQARRLTHLNLAFGIVVDNKIDVRRLIAMRFHLDRIRAANPDLVMCLSTGGGGAGGHGEATKPENIEGFVQSTMEAVRSLELDGIDCDWEFPCNTGVMEEKAQHVALMKRYREVLDDYAAERGRKTWLTIAAAAWDKYLLNTDIPAVTPYLDFINLMTYDIRDGAWEENYTGHHTNLYPPQDAFYDDSIVGCVEKYMKQGVPLDKIVIGAAFYTHRWDGVPNRNNGMNQKMNTPMIYGPSYTAIRLLYEPSDDYIKYWDETAKACWLFNGTSFITYDDPVSMRYKAEYVREAGLRGIMYWEHSSDLTGELFDSLYENLLGVDRL